MPHRPRAPRSTPPPATADARPRRDTRHTPPTTPRWGRGPAPAGEAATMSGAATPPAPHGPQSVSWRTGVRTPAAPCLAQHRPPEDRAPPAMARATPGRPTLTEAPAIHDRPASRLQPRTRRGATRTADHAAAHGQARGAPLAEATPSTMTSAHPWASRTPAAGGHPTRVRGARACGVAYAPARAPHCAWATRGGSEAHAGSRHSPPSTASRPGSEAPTASGTLGCRALWGVKHLRCPLGPTGLAHAPLYIQPHQ